MTSNQIGDIDFGDDKFGLGFGIVTEKAQQKLLFLREHLVGEECSAHLIGSILKEKL